MASSGRIVTMSATYGSAGSVVAPRLAELLGLSFHDRALSASVAAAAMESPSAAERAAAPPSRWMASLAHLASVMPSVPIPDSSSLDAVADLRADAERDIAAAVAGGPSLILGRAAAVVLAGKPGAFHVRLDGPVAARIERARAIESIDAREARRRCEAADRLRTTFVRRVYDRDPADASLYHVVIDSTAFAIDDVVTVLASAAESFWANRDR
jgi:cytidylate kinase